MAVLLLLGRGRKLTQFGVVVVDTQECRENRIVGKQRAHIAVDHPVECGAHKTSCAVSDSGCHACGPIAFGLSHRRVMRSRRFAAPDRSAHGGPVRSTEPLGSKGPEGSAGSPVDAGSEPKGHRAFGETTCQRVQQLPSHGGADHRERGAPLPSAGNPVRQDAPRGRGRLARRLHRESNVRDQKGVQSCQVGGVDGATADMTAHGPSPCRPARTPVCCGCPSHCMPVQFRGVHQQGLGAWPGAPSIVTTTPHRLLRTSRRRPPAPSPHLIRSCEVVSEQPACHRVPRASRADPHTAQSRVPSSARVVRPTNRSGAPPQRRGPAVNLVDDFRRDDRASLPCTPRGPHRAS